MDAISANNRQPGADDPRGGAQGQSWSEHMALRGTSADAIASPAPSPRAPDEGKMEAFRGGQESGGPSEQYQGSYKGTKKHGFGRLTINGSTYEGGFFDDMKHGNGTLTWSDGRQFRGQFERGRFHGAAVMTWPDGRLYCGQYIEDRKHGEGTFTWQDGRRYSGQWILGKRHGTGVYTNAKGITRTGTWNMDRPLSWEAPKPGEREQEAPAVAEALRAPSAQQQKEERDSIKAALQALAHE